MAFVTDLLSGQNEKKAAKSAADAQVQAAQIGADTIEKQQAQTRADLSPYLQAGNAGLSALLYGLTGQQIQMPNSPTQQPIGTNNQMPSKAVRSGGGAFGGAREKALAAIAQKNQADAQTQNSMATVTGQPMGMGAGDLMKSFGYEDFKTDPSYDFRLSRGMDGVQSSAAANGSLMSGAALKSLNDYNRGTFDQQYSNERTNYQNEQATRYGRLLDLMRTGQNSAAQVGATGASAAQGVANLQTAQGQAIANGKLNAATARSKQYDAIGGAGQNAMEFMTMFL